MNDKERYYISFYNTLSPNGYNLTLGGGANCIQSEETKRLKSLSMIGKNKNKLFPKRKRKYSEDDDLSKYIRCIRNKNEEKTSFNSKNVTLEEKYNLALTYLNSYQVEIS